MVRLFYSNRTEELLAELAKRVRTQQGRDGALVPVRIVVPNPAVEGYVRLGVAREAGIAANLDLSLLTRFAADVAAPADARVADAAALEAMALALLLDETLLGEREMAPVRAYLGAAGEAPETVDVRRVQLAARIGRIFEEYTYSRAELLAGWRRGTVLDGAYAETEGWQRRLWLGMFGEAGLAHGRTPRIVPLHEAVAGLEAGHLEARGAVHVFGFAHVARTFHELLDRLGRAREVHVYALSPCEGFWEDVDRRDPAPLHLWSRPGREHVRALNAIAGFDHDDRFVDPLEQGPRTLLRQIQSDVLRREPARESPPAQTGDTRDASVVVLEHASVRRECEAVASAIWALVKEDDSARSQESGVNHRTESLRFDEIAVLVPPGDAAAYAAHLPAVFREAYELPYRIVGLPPVEPSRIAEAVELLLALPLGRFARGELLRLAVHPAIVAGLDGVDPEKWLAWCDALGVVHGADRSDHEGTYIDRDILNWDQGLRRLALGAFMAGDASGDGSPFRIGDDAYVPHEVAGSDVHDAASFGVLLRSLVEDAKFAREAVLPLRQWAALLRTLVTTYVTPSSETEADELSRCLRRIHSVGEVDLGDRTESLEQRRESARSQESGLEQRRESARSQENGLEQRRVGYRVACELARARLSGAAAARTGEGVVVSTLAATRPLPFRAVFACGMGEGRFPAPDAEDPLDLRWAKRQGGDVTARDRDKYAFLELLLGTRDRLFLSYVSRDPLTGDPLAPSSVVQELLHALERGYVPDVAPLRRRHPLRRWDPAYFPDVFGREPTPLGTMELPEARAEARTLALRRSLDRHAEELTGRRGGKEEERTNNPTSFPPPLPVSPPLDAHAVVARADSGDPAWTALRQHLRLEKLPPAPSLADDRVVVPMNALVKFLEMPLQGWARFRLGLDELDDDDVLARESEPFETDYREETRMLREVLLGAAARGEPLEVAYDALVRDRELRGLGPSGVFAQGERADHVRALSTWKSVLVDQGVAFDAIEVHRFGRAGEHARADEVHEPVIVEVDVLDAAGVQHLVRAEIAGRTQPLGKDRTASITLAKRANDGDDDWDRADRKRAALRAFVDHAVLSAAGIAAGQPHSSIYVLATAERAVTDLHDLAPLSQDAAKRWLRDVVRELLGDPHAYFFPCEAVFVHHARAEAARSERADSSTAGPSDPVGPVIEEARSKLRGGDGPLGLRSAYGPVPRPQEYPAPREDAARAMIARRFGPILGPREDER
jgi:exodeoxyribonuclease V gamma subunit